MIRALSNFGWKQWLLLAALILFVGFTIFHVVRTAQRAAYWREHRGEPIAAWMPVKYVAHSNRVPPHVLYKALGIEPAAPGERKTLAEIANSQNRSFEEIKAVLEEAIENERLKHLPPENIIIQ